MISLAMMDQLIDEVRATYDSQPQDMRPDSFVFLVSPEMKRSLDLLISQRPHQRLLRKCQYRRIYRHRKRRK